MKRLKLFFACLLMAVLSIGQVWASNPAVDDVIFKEEFGGNNIQASAYTFTGTTTWSGSTTGLSYASTSTSSLLSNATANPITSDNFFFVKNSASTLTMSGIAIPSNVTEVTVSFQSNKTIVNCTYSFTGGDDYATGATSISGVQTFDIDCTDESTLYLKFTKTGTSSNARIDNVTVTVKAVSGGGSDPALSAAPAVIDFGTVDKGASVEAQDVTVTFENLTGSVTYSGLSGAFAASGTIAATGNKITITPNTANTGNFQQTLTVQSAVDSKSAEVTVKMNVVEPFDGLKLTFDVSSNPGEWPTTNSTTTTNYTYTLNEVDYTFALNNVKCNSGYLMLTSVAKLGLPAISGYKLVKIEATNSSGCSTSTQVSVSSSATTKTDVTGGTAQTWGTTSTKYTYNLSGTEENTMYYLWIANKNCQLVELTLYYEEAEAATVATPVISGTESFLTSTEVSIACTTDGATVYYTTDGTDPKTSESKLTYSAAFTLTNTATVRAIANLGAAWSAEATSKTFTKITPLTVAEAIAAIPNVDDVVNSQYVAGIVCTAGTSVNASGQMTYYISADGSEGTRLQIYLGKNINNTAFSSVSDLAIGDRVVVYGQLKNFKGTKEMNSGNYLIEKEDAVVSAPVFTPNGGGFMGETNVTITCATGSSNIYYTTDGSTTPSKSSTPYTEPIHLNATTTIKAIAYVGDDASVVITKSFTLTAPMTVAEALTALDSQDPINNTAVVGIISTAPASNPSGGKLTYYISDDGSDTDELEVYLGYGLNGASFSNKTDLQVGDEVTVFGNLKIFSGSSGDVKEFDAGNRLLAFNRPVVPVTSVELASAATVKVGNSINLSASVLPANATDKVIEWSIQSGNDKITLDNGAVTGVAEGTAVVRATSHADNTKYAECTITIEAADPTYAYYFYGKVTETAGIEDGQYLIVYEDESVAFNGGLETLDAAHNTIAVEIEDGLIVSNATTDAASFTIGVTAGTIQAAMGDYIGVTSYSNGLKQNADATTYPAHSFSIDEEGNAIVSLNNGWSGTMILNYNTGASDKRFRYYKDGSQKKIQLYKRFGTDVAPKANPQLAWDPADDIEITVGDEFTAPTLTYVEGFDGVAAVAIESDNPDLAIVTAGVVSLVADATGEANITATFAGNDNYKAATASYKITVNASVVPPTPAVSGNVVIIAEYESKFYAMTNSLASGALAGVEVEKDGSKIVVSSAEDKAAIQWTAAVTDANTTFQDGDGKYLAHTGTGTNLALADEPENWTFDSENGCYSAVSGRAFFFYNTSSVFKNYSINSNLGKPGYSGAPEVIEIDPDDIVITSKVDPQLAYSPASDEITVGDAWSAPALGYVEGFDGLAAISYESSDEAVATVSDAGVIALAGGTGTATITATFGGNTNYLAGSATYTVKVNEPAEDCDGSDDFITATSTSASSYNVERTTTNGWSSVNSALTTINSEARWLTMLGKTSQVGVITSPTLSDGIASLKIRYANTFSESNGVSFRVDIKQGEDVVKTFTVTKANSEVTQGTVYTETIEDINVAGEFQIIFTNLCPSAANSNKDRVSIGKLCWENYAAPAPVYETVREGLTAGNYFTVCWPKEMTAIKGATLWSFAGKDDNMAYLIQEEAPFEAGKPFIAYATSDKLEAVVEGDDQPAGSHNGLYGTLVDLSNSDLIAAGATYMLKGNALRPVGAGHLDANRAYVILSNIKGGAPTYAPAHKVRAIPMQGNAATGVDELNAAEAPVKMLIDGQIFILRGEKLYDTTGRLVK